MNALMKSIPFYAQLTKEKVSEFYKEVKADDELEIWDETPELPFPLPQLQQQEHQRTRHSRILDQLNSKYPQEIFAGLKCIAIIFLKQGTVEPFLAKIIQLLSLIDEIDVHMLCIYLVSASSAQVQQQQQKQQDASSPLLLCVAPFLKAMTSKRAIVKGDALRTICSLPLKEIESLLQGVLPRLLNDQCAYNRRVALFAFHQLSLQYQHQRLEDEHDEVELSQIPFQSTFERLEKMLKDNNFVQGAALTLFYNQILQLQEHYNDHRNYVCYLQKALAYLHPHFRKILGQMQNQSPFDLIYTIPLLGIYSFVFLLAQPAAEEDLKLLLGKCQILLRSPSPAIFIQIGQLFLLLSSSKTPLASQQKQQSAHNANVKTINVISDQLWQNYCKSALKFLNISSETKYIIIQMLIQIILKIKTLCLQSMYTKFYIMSLEKTYCKISKIRILALLVNQANVKEIIQELLHYTNDNNKLIQFEAIKAISQIFINKCQSQSLKNISTAIQINQKEVNNEALIHKKETKIALQALINLLKLHKDNPASAQLISAITGQLCTIAAFSLKCNRNRDTSSTLSIVCLMTELVPQLDPQQNVAAITQYISVLRQVLIQIPTYTLQFLLAMVKKYQQLNEAIKIQMLAILLDMCSMSQLHNQNINVNDENNENFSKISLNLLLYVVQLAKFDQAAIVRIMARQCIAILCKYSKIIDEAEIVNLQKNIYNYTPEMFKEYISSMKEQSTYQSIFRSKGDEEQDVEFTSESSQKDGFCFGQIGNLSNLIGHKLKLTPRHLFSNCQVTENTNNERVQVQISADVKVSKTEMINESKQPVINSLKEQQMQQQGQNAQTQNEQKAGPFEIDDDSKKQYTSLLDEFFDESDQDN